MTPENLLPLIEQTKRWSNKLALSYVPIFLPIVRKENMQTIWQDSTKRCYYRWGTLDNVYWISWKCSTWIDKTFWQTLPLIGYNFHFVYLENNVSSHYDFLYYTTDETCMDFTIFYLLFFIFLPPPHYYHPLYQGAVLPALGSTGV